MGKTMAGASLCQGTDFKGDIKSSRGWTGESQRRGQDKEAGRGEMRGQWMGAGDTCWPHGAAVTEGAAHSGNTDTGGWVFLTLVKLAETLLQVPGAGCPV